MFESFSITYLMWSLVSYVWLAILRCLLDFKHILVGHILIFVHITCKNIDLGIQRKHLYRKQLSFMRFEWGNCRNKDSYFINMTKHPLMCVLSSSSFPFFFLCSSCFVTTLRHVSCIFWHIYHSNTMHVCLNVIEVFKIHHVTPKAILKTRTLNL